MNRITLITGIAINILLGCGGEPTPDANTDVQSASPTPKPSWLDVGAAGRIVVPDAERVYLARTQEAMDELIDAQNDLDVDRVRALGQAGKVVSVPNNTDVVVVDATTLLRKVRIVEHNRTYTGVEAWVQGDFVRQRPIAQAQPVALPDYRVLDKVGGYIDVLVPSLSVNTPTDSLERLIRRIARAEGATQVTMYRTEEAFRANFSSSYAEQHPGALEAGYLGSLSGGRFTPSIYR